MREEFGLSPKERLLLEERLYAKSWKKEKTGEGDEEKDEDPTFHPISYPSPSIAQYYISLYLGKYRLSIFHLVGRLTIDPPPSFSENHVALFFRNT